MKLFFKIIDGITEVVYDVLKLCLALLGIYATYQFVFVMQLPVAFFVIIAFSLVTLAYFGSVEDEKVEALPIMMIESGKPVDVSNIGVGK